MGRRRKAALFLSLAAAVALTAGAANRPALRAARWLAPAQRMHALAFQPTECLARSDDPGLARRIAIGRAAFRTPLLLGGQAARAGLTCNGCHRNGRGNPDFHFPGLSGAPGTADVTSSLMSSHRGDGIDNPRPIPDLSGPRSALKIARDPPQRTLEAFIHGLVTEEFDGPEPTPATLDGLASYVRALSPASCPAVSEQPLRLDTYLDDAREGAQAALYALDANDRPTARLMLASARTALGMIDERYASAERRADRDVLWAQDRELAGLQSLVDAGGDPRGRIGAWIAAMPRWSNILRRDEPHSLFDAGRLREDLARSGPAALAEPVR